MERRYRLSNDLKLTDENLKILKGLKIFNGETFEYIVEQIAAQLEFFNIYNKSAKISRNSVTIYLILKKDPLPLLDNLKKSFSFFS